ncbi:HPP family protein [Gemmobacter serpentinus]|uniref:HPP family protein n=1 Tax=Gemmobacter serpentinus TaxID=2652247 RepID=UPI00124D1250|nr:HPP family protein [Gemmobacter serpentinus]
MISSTRRILRAFGPAIPAGSWRESLRAGGGALLGMGAAALVIHLARLDPGTGLYLIAPFGATSVLIFAVPASPLAQPWSAVIGNSVSALVAVAACLAWPSWGGLVPLAVGLAIIAMILARALHPPGGAVAMTVALNPAIAQEAGFWFALLPVALGTAALVLVAVLYARLTGRHYPFRQFEAPGSHGTADPAPAERLGLSEAELTDILGRYRQSLNLGVEDLARLIAAAEVQAAGHRTGPLLARDIMSRDLVTVGPQTPLDQVADQFRRHGFTSLPVVAEGDRFLGVIFQLQLIRGARDHAFRSRPGVGAAMAGLIGGRRVPDVAGDVMMTDLPWVTPQSPVSSLLPLLADGPCDAVPVLEGARITGIVTRTDLIAALARQSLAPEPPQP